MSATVEKINLGNGFYTIFDIAGILKIKRSKVSYLVRAYWNGILKKNINFKYPYDIEGALAVNFQSLIELKIFTH